jgi:hypothetical protein
MIFEYSFETIQGQQTKNMAVLVNGFRANSRNGYSIEKTNQNYWCRFVNKFKQFN